MVGILNHVEIAGQYAEDVLTGKQIACDLIVKACERFQRDLKNQGKKKFPFVFDAEKANRACRFIEKMPHIKGEWAKKKLRLTLEPWQCFVVCNIFGWICSKTIIDHDGHELMLGGSRRFRTVYLEVARKNGKSMLLSAIGNYMLIADGEEGAEIYSAATTHKQAKIVWEDAKKMIDKLPGLKVHKGVDTNAKNISLPDKSCKFEPLHSQGETLDGLNVHCAINDELHAHKKRDLYDVLETATGSRTQPLILNITTAGTNKAGICFELRTYVVKLLGRIFTDETFFGVIYTLDKDDDELDIRNWPKANPNYGVSVYPFDMQRLAKKAKESPSSMNNFLTKRLNIWCNAEVAWMDMQAWDKCADTTLNEDDFANDPCWFGVDLASKIDINALVRLYKRIIDGETHVFCFPTFYLPEKAIEDGANSQYGGWRRRGLLKATPGNIIDMDQIESETKEQWETLGDPQECCFDPGHNATQWATHLDDEGLEMVEVRPTVLNFSEPLKWLEALVLDGRFHHAGNEVLTWMISNVVVKHDFKDNIFPRKERIENKIDGPVAICTGLNRLLGEENAAGNPTVVVA